MNPPNKFPDTSRFSGVNLGGMTTDRAILLARKNLIENLRALLEDPKTGITPETTVENLLKFLET